MSSQTTAPTARSTLLPSHILGDELILRQPYPAPCSRSTSVEAPQHYHDDNCRREHGAYIYEDMFVDKQQAKCRVPVLDIICCFVIRHLAFSPWMYECWVAMCLALAERHLRRARNSPCSSAARDE